MTRYQTTVLNDLIDIHSNHLAMCMTCIPTLTNTHSPKCADSITKMPNNLLKQYSVCWSDVFVLPHFILTKCFPMEFQCFTFPVILIASSWVQTYQWVLLQKLLHHLHCLRLLDSRICKMLRADLKYRSKSMNRMNGRIEIFCLYRHC